MAYTPQQFVQKWQDTTLGERQSYQLHFIDLCQLVGHEPPGAQGIDSQGRHYAFEYGVKKDVGGQGFADVFYEGHFAIEYKGIGKYKDLNDAYRQLQQYREKLNNPPLLIVTDIENWAIHTNWPNSEKKVYEFKHADIANRPSILKMLRDLFEAPDRLHPRRNTEQVTTDAAKAFQLITDNMRDWEAAPDRIAHFLTKLVFCLFAEDAGLLPSGPGGETGIFAEIIERTRREPLRFVRYAEELFKAMADGGEVMFQKIPYFNGSLFEDVQVEELKLEALIELEKASNLNWASVEPAIFGTLFERSLDPGKRAQLGAHYTSRDDILLIVEPVLMQPLRREWQAIRAEAAPIREKYDAALKETNRRNIKTHGDQLEALRETMLKRLREIRVLDPACGSGNFLYVSLQLLMDMEKRVILDDLFAGLRQPFPEVHPRQMYGIEKDPIAHALASIVVWIGYIQWQKNNGYISQREPILEDLHGNIQRMDAIITLTPAPSASASERGEISEPDWPEVDVIVGNPPFLGDKKMRAELGDEYVNNLRKFYGGRVPGGADLVTYWYEKARAQIEKRKAKRAGLLATNSIRNGANREILKRIKDTGDIFLAWSDRDWILDGAALNISVVGFDNSEEKERYLDGKLVSVINSDLTSNVDVTVAKTLKENSGLCFLGIMKGGPFDIDEQTAQAMLSGSPNRNGRPNSDVVKPRINGQDVTGRPNNSWVIDFGVDTTEADASVYELPFDYVLTHVKPVRDKNRDSLMRTKWWLHGRPRPALREASKQLTRVIVTPEVAKHRIFVWLNRETIPDHRLHVFARDDDYFFGILHSIIHEVWSLRQGSTLEDRPCYTSTKTFETFPFPWPPGKEDTESEAYKAIASAAKQLHEERAAWLNPPGTSEKALKDRTLTNLYNALNGWRGKETIKVKPDAADFAPRLDELHTTLDKAVCAAYGWPESTLVDDEEILRRLLELNLARAGDTINAKG